MRPSFKDAVLQQDLRERGFARVTLLTATEVKTLLDRLTSQVSSAWARSSEICGQRFTFHSTTLDTDFDYRRRAFDIVKQTVEPALNRFLDRYKLVTAGVVVKGPASGDLSLHSDPTLTRSPEVTALTIWCPLVDTDDENGGLRVIPGSHAVATQQITGTGIPGYHWPYVKELTPYSVPLSLKAGEAAIFDSRLLHGSPPNGSDRIRAAVMIACIPEEEEAVHYAAVPGGNSSIVMFNHSEARYLKYPAADFFSGGVVEELIGTMPNPNQPLSLHEFERRLLCRGNISGDQLGR